MKQTVRKFVKRHQLWEQGDHLIAAVSGGIDSMVLLYLLADLRALDKMQLTCLHIDHSLRPEDAENEKLLVQEACEKLHVPFIAKQVDVPFAKLEGKSSTQTAARNLRYEAYQKALEETQAVAVVTAHHADDQMETVLMQQVRGTWLGGAPGIPVKREIGKGRVVRPFLSVGKKELIDYQQSQNVPYLDDPSNQSEAYTRNRFRKYVIPYLLEENPSAHLHFQAQVERLEEDRAFMFQEARKCIDETVTFSRSEEAEISISTFKKWPIPLQRYGFHLVLNYLYSSLKEPVLDVHISACMELLYSDHPSKAIDLPVMGRAWRSYDMLYLSVKKVGDAEETEEEKRLPVPGSVETELGFLTARIENSIPNASSCEECLVVPLHWVTLPLKVRTKHAGDRIQPFGMKGKRQKLSRIFIDEKVDKHLRQKWPVVTDANDNILWLPLLKQSEWANLEQEPPPYLVCSFTSMES
ncbi:tRNA lysidine(34) synthetase TilS [Salsuginibacillus kocurii]|uniref:tRNA lysidine(34) synthetase TilS n=1 Tax=Salsuginibacillus kocurii TaxID=427078 RepID=UPI000374F017|nr:tRNA lysidine(34) synthetase TilS [Salsuginibacillus kocurii]